MLTLKNHFEGHICCTVAAVLKMVEPTFCYCTITFNSSIQSFCFDSFFHSEDRQSSPGFKHLLLLMNVCLTESHILTNITECALHLPMRCCAYWNVYCATVVCFCCLLLLLHQWCLFVKCSGWKFDLWLVFLLWMCGWQNNMDVNILCKLFLTCLLNQTCICWLLSPFWS